MSNLPFSTESHRSFNEETKTTGNSVNRSYDYYHNDSYSGNRYNNFNYYQDYHQYNSKQMIKPYQSSPTHCQFGATCYRKNSDHIRQYHQLSFQPDVKYNTIPSTPPADFMPKSLFYFFSHHGTDEGKKEQQKAYMFAIAGKQSSMRDSLEIVEELANLKGSLLTDFIRDSHEDHRKLCQGEILPIIANLVLQTPTLFLDPESLPMLSQGDNKAVQLTREQCACLIANMFMCTTVDQHNNTLNRRFNFSDLYRKTGQPSVDELKKQKIACILNYFKQIMTVPSSSLSEQVTFKRHYLDENYPGSSTDIGRWINCQQLLQEIEIDCEHKIEDAKDSVEVDFANRFLGGGVLGKGAVQEEIQFITRPEQLAGVLFCESMTDEEAILIQGAKMYSQYQGYSKTFAFQSSDMSIEESKREVIAMDAIDFSASHIPQFSEIAILRELNKAYVAFYDDDLSGETSVKKPISTGNWGCGAFRGDMQLKFILQWIAASGAQRKLIYHPMSNPRFHEEANAIVEAYKDKPVGLLVKDVLDCSQYVKRSHNQENQLFECLKNFKRDTQDSKEKCLLNL